MARNDHNFGDFLSAEISLRGWTQKDLAEITGISEGTVCKIFNEDQNLTNETASAIACAFDIATKELLKLEFNLKHLGIEEKKPKNADLIKLKSECKSLLPLQEMKKKGWISFDNTVDGIKSVLYDLYSSEDIAEIKESEKGFAARQTRQDEMFTRSYSAAWFAYAKMKLNKEDHSVTFDIDKLKKLANNLHTYTCLENGVELFLSALEDCGVKFFVLEHLSKTYLDGAAFILNGKPHIAYTGRYNRKDNFWFVVSHEIGHILLHYDQLNNGILDTSLDHESEDVREIEADNFASSVLKKEEILALGRNLPKYLTFQKVQNMANLAGVSLDVFMGSLAHEGMIEYRQASKYINTKVLSLIPHKYFLV